MEGGVIAPSTAIIITEHPITCKYCYEAHNNIHNLGPHPILFLVRKMWLCIRHFYVWCIPFKYCPSTIMDCIMGPLWCYIGLETIKFQGQRHQGGLPNHVNFEIIATEKNYEVNKWAKLTVSYMEIFGLSLHPLQVGYERSGNPIQVMI